jgi:hypothetical protein
MIRMTAHEWQDHDQLCAYQYAHCFMANSIFKNKFTSLFVRKMSIAGDIARCFAARGEMPLGAQRFSRIKNVALILSNRGSADPRRESWICWLDVDVCSSADRASQPSRLNDRSDERPV